MLGWAALDWARLGQAGLAESAALAAVGCALGSVVRDLVDEVVLVSEEEILAHMRLAWERMKLTIEPSAAVGVAVACSAWMRARHNAGIEDAGVVLCGGNVDLAALPF